MTPKNRNKSFAINKDMVPQTRQERPGTTAHRESFAMQNIQMLNRLSRKSVAGFEFGTGLKKRQSTGMWGSGSQSELQSATKLGSKQGHIGSTKFHEKNMNYQNDILR